MVCRAPLSDGRRSGDEQVSVYKAGKCGAVDLTDKKIADFDCEALGKPANDSCSMIGACGVRWIPAVILRLIRGPLPH